MKRALGKADTAIDLKQFLPAGFQGKAVNAAYKYFYDEMRTHLFHAKASRQPLLPYETDGTSLLVSRHRLLTSFYLALLEHVTGVRRSSGGMLAEVPIALVVFALCLEHLTEMGARRNHR